jgi:hypothetical protein
LALQIIAAWNAGGVWTVVDEVPILKALIAARDSDECPVCEMVGHDCACLAAEAMDDFGTVIDMPVPRRPVLVVRFPESQR